MNRRCLGCRALIQSGSYCAFCRVRNGSTREWRNVRARVLARDQWTCVLCGATAHEVDHIQQVIFGGSDDERNLRSLCIPCHNQRHA